MTMAFFTDDLGAAFGARSTTRETRPMQAERGRPEAVVFDLGNVLVTWDRRLLFESLFDDEAELEHFLGAVYTLEANDRLDRGQPLAAFCAALADEHPAYEKQIRALEERWIETIGPPLDGTVEILRELKAAGVRCFALSNWNADTFAMVEHHHEFLGWFDGVVLSGREGVTKPDPEIYRRLFRRHAVDPADAVFVDDSPANVDTARRLGMDAVLFTDPASARVALRERGLPV
jgi:2-haloacid dehalogenase